MTIKNRLYIGAAITIVLILSLLIVVWTTSSRIATVNNKYEILEDLNDGISDLDLVAYDYLLYKETRMEEQWNLKYNSLSDTWDELVTRQDEMPADLDYDNLGLLFSQVVANSETIEELTEQGAPQQQIDNATLLEKRLVAELLMTSHSILTEISSLSDEARLEAASYQRLVSYITTILTAAIVITVAISSFFITRSISKPLDELTKGAKIIGSGDLEYKVGIKSKDELGQLATAFNGMTESLKIITASRDELDREVAERKRAEAELVQHREHLEELVGSRTAELERANEEIKDDFAKRRQVEEEVRRLAKFPSENPNPVLRIAKDGTVIYANDASTPLLKYWGSQVNQLLPQEQRKLIKDALKTARTEHANVEYQDRIMLLTFAPVPDLEQVNIYGLDITEQKLAEQSLAESEENVRLMVSEVKDYAIIMLDPNGVIASWNEGAQRIKGYSAGEIIGRHMSILYNGKDVKAGKPAGLLKEALKDGRAEDEGVRVRKDGSQFMASVIITAIYDEDGKHIGFSKVTRDITERKQAEEEISRLAKFPSENPNPVLRIVKDGTIIYANDASTPLLEYWGSQVNGKLPADWRKKISNSLISNISLTVEVEYQNKTVSLTLAPVSDLEQVNIYGLDITERKWAEQELKESEAKFRGIFESELFGALFWDANGDIVDANDAFLEIVGYSRKDIKTGELKWSELTPPEYAEIDKEKLQELAEKGVIDPFEKEYIHKSGRRIPILVGAATLSGERNKGIAFIVDITERKRAEQERENLLGQLEDKTKELEQIVYVSSHDLRSPLVNVQGFAKELQNSLASMSQVLDDADTLSAAKEAFNAMMDGDIKSLLKFINSSVYKMDTLMQGLLKLSRLGRAAVNIVKLDMNKLISAVVQSFEYRINEMNITLDVEHLSPSYGDKVQINQVFSNLVDNAIKYLAPNRSGIIKISSSESNGNVIYSVKDNGVGIMAEHQDKIFEIFHQLNPKESPGEGLGLTIVQRILERHGGKVWLESALDQGCKFYVSLPATKK